MGSSSSKTKESEAISQSNYRASSVDSQHREIHDDISDILNICIQKPSEHIKRISSDIYRKLVNLSSDGNLTDANRLEKRRELQEISEKYKHFISRKYDNEINPNNFADLLTIDNILNNISIIIETANVSDFPAVNGNDSKSMSQLFQHLIVHLDKTITNVTRDMDYYSGKSRTTGQKVYCFLIGSLVNLWWWRSDSTMAKHHKKFIVNDLRPLKGRFKNNIKKLADANQTLDNIINSFDDNTITIEQLKKIITSNKASFVMISSMANFIKNE